MRVLVCGGRTYGVEPTKYNTMPAKLAAARAQALEQRRHLFDVLDRLHAERPITMLIEGEARGADTLAASWASSRRVELDPYGITQDEIMRYNRGAGPARNARMLRDGLPELVVAFPGGTGTADMVAKATAAGVEVRRA